MDDMCSMKTFFNIGIVICLVLIAARCEIHYKNKLIKSNWIVLPGESIKKY